MYKLHIYCLRKPEKDNRSLGTRITDGCELPCGCLELNLGPVEEQPVVLLTADMGTGDLNLGLHAHKNKRFSPLSSLSSPTYSNLKTTQGQDSS